MQSPDNENPVIWKGRALFWASILLTGVLLTTIFYDAFVLMVEQWTVSEEYGYGFIIPLIAIFFVWQKNDQLAQIRFGGSWWGVVLTVIGLGIMILGHLSTLYIVIQYSFLIVLLGVVFALTGWQGFKIVWVPVLLLFFMIPLPQFLYQNLSASLQLISSELGVAIIRLFGVSVHLEGNVIDLGNYKLQVVEACSGLRYLFPLASLSFIAAYMFKAAFWKRAVVFLSSIPITIAMNSFRIGIIGVFVEFGGIAQAEGFLHYFEGWVIFMACMAILLLEIWLLTKVGRDRRPFQESFNLDFPSPIPSAATVNRRGVPLSFMTTILLLGLALLQISSLNEREEIISERVEFSEFPLAVGDWKGKPDRLEQIYLDVLKLDDYFITDYVNGNGELVNFYVAYYASQRKGESAHSPRSCLPGGGWKIADLSQRTLDQVYVGDTPLRLNRAVIRKGENAQLVYYWFQQRGRVITNEYAVKWYLFWDAMTKNRSDGALVRLTTFVAPGEDLSLADDRLLKFTRDLGDALERHIPN